MKSVTLFMAALAFAAPAAAQHVHDMNEPQVAASQAPAPQTAAPQSSAPQTAAPQQPGAAARPAQPAPIEVPWNDAIPAGTPEHAARALKESPRHGEWADIKMADGTTLKSWVVYPERPTKSGVVLVIHDIRGLSDIIRAVGYQLA